MILINAARKVARYNELGLHYDLVANQIYEKRFVGGTAPFHTSFLPYIVAGLISFDMGRMMGKGLVAKYEIEAGGFASRLNSKLQEIKPLLDPLINLNLTQTDLPQHSDAIDAIKEAYNTLSAKGNGALHENQTKCFHVGATKILHFLNPKLFIIVDSNAAQAFRDAHNVLFRNATQPGYSALSYIECMKCAQKDILTYGLEQFQALEPSVPITRIYDKLTFATGSGL